MRFLSVFVLTLGFAACSNNADRTPTADSPAASAAAATQPDATIAAAQPQGEEPAFVTSVASMRVAPNDEKKVSDPKGSGKQVNNWLALLYRGEQVTALKQEGDWMQIRASDDSVGWMKADTVLLARGASLATVLEETKTFTRPDFAALDVKTVVAPATLLLITKTKEPFSEVNLGGSSRAWVPSDKLSTTPNEIEACKLIGKARKLDEKGDPAAKEFWTLAKGRYADTKLVQNLVAAEATAAGAEAAAAPAEGQPAQPAQPAEAPATPN